MLLYFASMNIHFNIKQDFVCYATNILSFVSCINNTFFFSILHIIKQSELVDLV